jgi:ketosteroid isomerase-like protein
MDGFASLLSPRTRTPLGSGMRQCCLILAFLLLLVPIRVVFAQAPEAHSAVELEPALRAAMAAREKANREGDIALIEALMTPDYVQTDIGGRVQTGSEWLQSYFKPLSALIRAGDFRWNVFEEMDAQARAYGSAVIVVGKLKLEGEGATFVPGRDWVKTPGSRLGPMTLSFTRVWVKRDGKWLLAAIHNSVPPSPPSGK